jgi:SAM-dependent methyltransferase
VEAIDLPATSSISGHARNRHWPIQDYDGAHIPFDDRRFDIIYSSNVLEHVEQLDSLMAETRRVLRPDGIALHLLPNPQWRILSLLSYYPGQAIDALRYLTRKRAAKTRGDDASSPAPQQSKLQKALKRLLPHTHGAVGTPISEVGRFSRGQWDRYFLDQGWEVVEYSNNGLIASGDYLLGTALSIGARRAIGQMTGGIAHVYLLRPSAKGGRTN